MLHRGCERNSWLFHLPADRPGTARGALLLVPRSRSVTKLLRVVWSLDAEAKEVFCLRLAIAIHGLMLREGHSAICCMLDDEGRIELCPPEASASGQSAVPKPWWSEKALLPAGDFSS